MIKSMTGFGQAELKSSQGNFRIELKSTNHKFLEVSARVPGYLSEFEEAMRREVAKKVRRGKILLHVSSPDPSMFSTRLVLNEGLAKEVFKKAVEVRKMLKMDRVSDDALLKEVLRYPDVLRKDGATERGSVYTEKLKKVMTAALSDLEKSRASEGSALLKDLSGRVAEIKSSLAAIEKRIPLAAKEFKKSLESRLKDFLKESELDRDRLTIEVAQYLKSSDISEEVTRLSSHIVGMARALKEAGELGRKLDFIAQEMTRETNTIGAKSSDAAITDAVIRIKSSIEKIREQAQNVE
jgi:uncharacterized protein (TIGR00255 family)